MRDFLDERRVTMRREIERVESCDERDGRGDVRAGMAREEIAFRWLMARAFVS